MWQGCAQGGPGRPGRQRLAVGLSSGLV